MSARVLHTETRVVRRQFVSLDSYWQGLFEVA